MPLALFTWLTIKPMDITRVMRSVPQNVTIKEIVKSLYFGKSANEPRMQVFPSVRSQSAGKIAGPQKGISEDIGFNKSARRSTSGRVKEAGIDKSRKVGSAYFRKDSSEMLNRMVNR